ncbi:MAG: GntR family transcriptional regulator, transcriptional repressor for pyruvate dehydrogenase complex [Thermosediminibacterales bacterium]|nr:GntR family transcriptional regulator, transcriptional repressor for pyruvate dehydrogenase complex [Thermosediminibacterales bacterium]
MKVKPIKRQTICDQIVEQIKEMIKNGDLKPGDKLPGERDLANLFNVGRSSVREALIVLNSLGLIRKTTEGSFVNNVSIYEHLETAYKSALNEIDFAELIEARRLIETTTAELAAQKANEEDIVLLEEILSEMSDENLEQKEFAKLDSEFHLNIALSSKNKILYEFLNIVSELLESLVEKRLWNYKSFRIKQILKEHHQILDAIKSKDSLKAREYMYKHLMTAEDFLKKDKQQKTKPSP